MKPLKFVFVLGAFLVGFAIQSFAQEELPAVEIVAVNYKYLSSVNGEEVAKPVKQLEWEAAAFDVKEAAFYEDEYDNYFVSFYLPEGKVLAAYDRDGKLLRTAEKFKDVALPKAVRESVAKKYPGWAISKDVYRVNYHESGEVTKKYKLLLKKGDKRMRVKIDDQGKFI